MTPAGLSAGGMAGGRNGRSAHGGRSTLCAVLLATVLVVTAGCESGNHVGQGVEPVYAIASAGPVVEAKCPDSYDLNAKTIALSRSGLFVPVGAARALLCTYAHSADAELLPLTDSRPLGAAAEYVVGELNSLPAIVKNASGSNICLALARDQYQIALTYADRQPVVVKVNANCGTVEQGGAGRRLVSLKALLKHWEQ